MKKYNYTKDGLMQFFEQHNEESSTNGFILDPEKVQTIIDTGVEIAPYIAPVKTNDQLIAEIDLELTSLDATPRMLSGALLGDQYSIDKLKGIEVKQSALRESRRALI